MSGDRPTEYLKWVEEKRNLVPPPPDAGREYVLDLSGWKIKLLALPFQKRGRRELERRSNRAAAAAPRARRVKAVAV